MSILRILVFARVKTLGYKLNINSDMNINNLDTGIINYFYLYIRIIKSLEIYYLQVCIYDIYKLYYSLIFIDMDNIITIIICFYNYIPVKVIKDREI